jgi:hypothetical protein
MRLPFICLSIAALVCLASGKAHSQTIQNCATVDVATSTDILALAQDAACFHNQSNALLEASHHALEEEQARVDRIAYVKAHPPEIMSPGLGGLPDIPSDFDPKLPLIKSWGTGAIPPSMGSDPLGAFRFICGTTGVKYDDAIQWPGQPGRSHLHQNFGNTQLSGNSTYESLRAAGDSSCGSDMKGHALNRSGYWVAAMLDGKGNVVQPDNITIYYKRIPASDPHCGDPAIAPHYGWCLKLPNGLRFIAGSNLKGGWRQAHTPKQTPYVGAFRFNCITSQGLGIAGISGQYFDLASMPRCPVGAQVEQVMQMPNCWDGRRLDAADHGSHMDYMTAGHCPLDHPYLIPFFLQGINYLVKEGDDTTLWSLSSDAVDPTKPRGWSIHGDWFGAWDPVTLQTWTDNCIDKHLSCTGGDLGNGTQMPASVPLHLNADGVTWTKSYTNPRHLIPVPPAPAMPAMAH